MRALKRIIHSPHGLADDSKTIKRRLSLVNIVKEGGLIKSIYATTDSNCLLKNMIDTLGIPVDIFFHTATMSFLALYAKNGLRSRAVHETTSTSRPSIPLKESCMEI